MAEMQTAIAGIDVVDRSRGRAVACRRAGRSSSPTCISRRPRRSPAAACSCRPTTPPRRCSPCRADAAAQPAPHRLARRQLPRFRRLQAGSRSPTARGSPRCSAGASGSGSAATTIRLCRPTSAATIAAELALEELTFRHEPLAGDGEGRGRRASPSRRQGARARGEASAAAPSRPTARAWCCRPSACCRRAQRARRRVRAALRRRACSRAFLIGDGKLFPIAVRARSARTRHGAQAKFSTAF